ncbi:MAG: M20/M25/M40 family metallo-hydrolase [Candidatus Aenigmarchaeota archaeon]|nr:M20/M25/M40 family metallo-hydrolase [Candidatus Aenigmarchaeota archaeon]
MKLESLVKTLKVLVKYNSVTGNERELAEFLKEKLEKNFYVRLQKFSKNQANLISVSEKQSEKKLILSGHLDTVDVVPGWKTDPFILTIKGKRAYGLGALDMKSGVSILLHLYRKLSKELKNTELWLVLTGDEEGHSYGMYKFLEEFRDERFAGAIFTEPLPGDKVALVDKAFGRYAVDVNVSCNGGHAALKDEEPMVRILKQISEALKNLRKKCKKKKIGRCSYTVSHISAGSMFLSSPHEIVLRINHRSTLGETLNMTIKEVRDSFKKAGLRVSVKPIERPTPFLKPFDHSDKKLSKIFSTIIKKKDVAKSVFDGNLTAMFGIPTINIGPTGGNMHSSNEYVNLTSLLKVYRTLYSGIKKFDSLG